MRKPRDYDAELKALEVGQTIPLQKGPDDPLDIACGGVPLAQAQIGQRRGKIAVRLVTDVSKERKRFLSRIQAYLITSAIPWARQGEDKVFRVSGSTRTAFGW